MPNKLAVNGRARKSVSLPKQQDHSNESHEKPGQEPRDDREGRGSGLKTRHGITFEPLGIRVHRAAEADPP